MNIDKKCFSVKSLDFEKSIKSLGKAKVEKLYDKINRLEAMENDHSMLPTGVRSAETYFGKSLSRMGKKNIYVLELGEDRAMAVILEKEGKKVYAWFWGGSHEDYNKKFSNISALNKVENSIATQQGSQIAEKLSEMKIVDKSQQLKNIGDIRKQFKQPEFYDAKNKYKY